jgi:hypothetical protein
MTGKLTKSSSMPGLLTLGTSPPNTHYNNQRKATLTYSLGYQADAYKGQPPTDQIIRCAAKLSNPSWRLEGTKDAPRTGPQIDEDPAPQNMKWPRVAPAWLKHDKQVLRFYAFFQESVPERPDENSRYRHCVIMYCMEDGTIRISEPRIENSGIAQGQFLKRHRIPRADGMGFLGPTDFEISKEVEIYGKHFHITGADRFTRWFFQENGVELEPDEPVVEDLWEKNYKFTKTSEKGGLARSRSVVEAKHLCKYMLGAPPQGRTLTQFLENDRKVLRFKAYWDDHTLYGARIYAIVHFFLADNTVEVNEAHSRNSGRDKFPIFYRRGKLLKENRVNAYPGMLEADPLPYLPEDFRVGDVFHVWGRKFVIYDCDDFTRHFYKEYMGIDQADAIIDVSEPPIKHTALPPPPHIGCGREEDSLLNVLMVRPKPPKQDLVRLMTLSGEILRFECKMVNGQPEDEVRKLIIGWFPADNMVACWELAVRNSGFIGGRFCQKQRKKNPDTGKFFELTDFAVGKQVMINAHPLLITRADEHALQYTEAHCDEYPYADPVLCAQRLAPVASDPAFSDPEGIDPDQLKDLAIAGGVDIIDHEIITLLRFFGVDEIEGVARISGPKVLATIGM